MPAKKRAPVQWTIWAAGTIITESEVDSKWLLVVAISVYQVIAMRWLIAHILFVPSLLWNMLLGRVLRIRNWWDSVDEQVILGARPTRRDVTRLAELGVTAVVNTCEEYAGPTAAYEQLGIEQIHVPTIDFTPPTLDSVCQAVRFMEQQTRRGGRLYVHCKAGRGRSATVVICWLMAARGMTASQAQAHLISCRPHVLSRLDQRQVVKDFAGMLASGDWQAG